MATTVPSSSQWLRKASLLLVSADEVLDLSETHFTFEVAAADVESPANCTIRVYNLARTTVTKAMRNYTEVILQAGYEGNLGVIFKGTVKYYRRGKESATDTYLDIQAADGDIPYNFGVVAQSFAAGTTPQQRVEKIIEQGFSSLGLKAGQLAPDAFGGTLPAPRGKVVFGMARASLRNELRTLGASWSISNGKINVVPLDGYLLGEAVELTALTGLVGIPEQTTTGIEAKCLLNPRLTPGVAVRINNAAINAQFSADPKAPPVPYNQWKGLQYFADVARDGLYRVFVAEHSGDTRGQNWHTKIVGLAINSGTNKVTSYG